MGPNFIKVNIIIITRVVPSYTCLFTESRNEHKQYTPIQFPDKTEIYTGRWTAGDMSDMSGLAI
jgi:hypothetical protein